MKKLMQILLIAITLLPLPFSLAKEIFALHTENNQEKIDNQKSSSSMAKFRDEYQLLFVYTSKCPYCHKFSKILDSFSKDKKLHVAALTDDGGKIEPFTKAIYDRNKITALGVDGFPVLFVENKKTGKTHLLVDGLVSYSELEHTVDTLVKKLYQ